MLPLIDYWTWCCHILQQDEILPRRGNMPHWGKKLHMMKIHLLMCLDLFKFINITHCMTRYLSLFPCRVPIIMRVTFEHESMTRPNFVTNPKTNIFDERFKYFREWLDLNWGASSYPFLRSKGFCGAAWVSRADRWHFLGQETAEALSGRSDFSPPWTQTQTLSL